MSRKANSIFLEKNKAEGEAVPEMVVKLWKEWEVPVLVLLSLTLQVILALLGNRRRKSKSLFLTAVLWSAYMAADPVATLALGVISSNLTEFLKFVRSTPPLDPRLELLAFWSPFLLLHLGGPDTITAFQVEDNELWKRHLLSLVVQTGLTLYILFRAWTLSSLSALSGMMLAAGSIKYAERTWSLWSASYQKRRQKADRAFILGPGDAEYIRHFQTVTTTNLVVAATGMFPDTEGMFVDAFVIRDSRFKEIVESRSSTEVMKLIEMELKMMYDNLYTKARVIISYTGLALRFISFLLTCITLILFSSSERRKQHFHNIPEYSLTFLLFAASIGLELYAAFIFLTSYRMISWFRLCKIDGVARIMENLAKLRTQNWSNSMGQFSEISYFMQYKPKGPQLMSRILLRTRISLHVYHRPVPNQLKEFIHEHLKKAFNNKDKYSQKQLFFVQSKGRVPWDEYKEHVRIDDSTTLEHASSLFNKEFGEMIIFLHLATEVCYYIDRPVFANNANDSEYKVIFQTSRVSKYLSRYLMHLFVDSSDLLPQRTPLSKRKFYEDLNPSWQPFFTPYRYYFVPQGGGGGQGEGNRQEEKVNRRAPKVQACKKFWERSYIGNTSDISALRLARNLLKVLRPDDDRPSQSSQQEEQERDALRKQQLKGRWEMLNAVWVELLAYAANQCEGKAHAQYLTKGGELLTHVWVLLGHFGFIDEAIIPFKDGDDEELTYLKDYEIPLF